MALTPGTRLGPYEVTAQIGEGGMGEVYQATDTNLKRAVAIKVLPESVAGDAERLARFQREAEVLAAFNHLNIAQIHGLEKSAGTIALVMELVEGPTLADRIAQGAIPIDEALPIAKQIAEALEAAHEQGIIHRDLKPANIKVRLDGTVKVLDFGLAKAMEPTVMSPDSSQSPTITSPAMTQAGMILGTAAYMSPEQARGKPVDKRADIWAFGAVLFEMLSGTCPFEGEDIAETLGAVIHKEPVWSRLPTATPAAVRTVMQRCLQKEPRQRLRDIGDVHLALQGAFETNGAPMVEAVAAAQPTWWRVMPWATGAVIGGALVGAMLWTVPPSSLPVYRLNLSLEAAAPLAVSNNFIDVAIAPDGQRIVYPTGDGVQILSLSDGEPTHLVTGGQPLMPFFSPDGAWVGFLDQRNQELKRVSVNGGAIETVAHVGAQLRGVSWAPDGTIVYASAIDAGLWRVSATGGEPEQLTVPGEGETHGWPSFLPEGQALLFTIGAGDGTPSRIAVLSLETRVWDVLQLQGTTPRYVPAGYVVYALDDTLRAVPFDLARRRLSGESVAVETRLLSKGTGAANYSVSRSGSLVYLLTGSETGQSLGCVTRGGGMLTPLLERTVGVFRGYRHRAHAWPTRTGSLETSGFETWSAVRKRG